MQRPTTDAPVRRRSRKSRIFLLTLLAIGLAFLFRQGLVPSWLSPLPALDLASANPWLVDWRLAEIHNSPGLCKRTLKPPHIEAQPIADSPSRTAAAGSTPCACRRPAASRPATTRSPARPPSRSPSGSSTTCSRSRRRCSASASPRSRASAATPAATSSATPSGRAGAASTRRPTRSTSAPSSSPTDAASASPSTGRATASRPASCAPCTAAPAAISASRIGPDYNEAHRDHFHFDRGMLSRCK